MKKKLSKSEFIKEKNRIYQREYHKKYRKDNSSKAKGNIDFPEGLITPRHYSVLYKRVLLGMC